MNIPTQLSQHSYSTKSLSMMFLVDYHFYIVEGWTTFNQFSFGISFSETNASKSLHLYQRLPLSLSHLCGGRTRNLRDYDFGEGYDSSWVRLLGKPGSYYVSCSWNCNLSYVQFTVHLELNLSTSFKIATENRLGSHLVSLLLGKKLSFSLFVNINGTSKSK
jgi:hypothetical protein